MFSLFKKKPKENGPPQLLDINGIPIEVGARVKSLRYELGECVVELEGREYFYKSVSKDQRVSYTRMVDAVTKNQKVEVIN